MLLDNETVESRELIKDLYFDNEKVPCIVDVIENFTHEDEWYMIEQLIAENIEFEESIHIIIIRKK